MTISDEVLRLRKQTNGCGPGPYKRPAAQVEAGPTVGISPSPTTAAKTECPLTAPEKNLITKCHWEWEISGLAVAALAALAICF